MTDLVAISGLCAIALFIISYIIMVVQSNKAKSSKVPKVLMIVSIAIITISFVLAGWYGYAVAVVLLSVFFVWVVSKVKRIFKLQDSTEDKIANDPKWKIEKKVKDRLEYISFEVGGSFQLFASHPYSEKYKGYLKANQDRCVEFLEDGAIMVATHQIVDPNSSSSNGHALYIYTPNAVFKKTKASASGGLNENAILPTGMKFGIKEHIRTALVTKKVNVADATMAGAIIAGTAGAVVGAAQAMETNAKGGKSELASVGKTYCIQLFSDFIDYIFISKEVLKMCTPPPKQCISVETDTYWILEYCLEGNEKELQETLNYLNDIVMKLNEISEK